MKTTRMKLFADGHVEETITEQPAADVGHHAPRAKQYVCILRDGGYCMEEAADGNYVSHADYEVLRRQYDATAEGYRTALLAARRGEEAARADVARLDEIEWFGCNTGDCPHAKQSECDVALLGVVRSVLAERESARFLAATQEPR